jgi:hypothetical protein
VVSHRERRLTEHNPATGEITQLSDTPARRIAPFPEPVIIFDQAVALAKELHEEDGMEDLYFMDVRYEDTEHYAITKAFLQNPGRMIREMFRDIDNESD